ncbi:uncharacterized protein LOC121863641 [Homarus americanus]|uniref:uncharacterized protein LOC121863641 n=1 Tax=Homarus americanus TaxID=6706 RepID=UPI001C473047|nr:uncharacterized protein LOC121863641 [Homarus americanus]
MCSRSPCGCRGMWVAECGPGCRERKSSVTPRKMRHSLFASLVYLLVGVVWEVPVKGRSDGQVGTMVSQVVREHLLGCHLVLATTTKHSPVYSQIIRHLATEMETGVVVETTVMFSQDQPTQEERHLLQGLWGDATLSCHVLILDNTAMESHSIVRFLERCGLWLRPKTRVVVVGGKSGVETLLLHHALRNTNHALYIALLNHSLYVVAPNTNITKKRPDEGRHVTSSSNAISFGDPPITKAKPIQDLSHNRDFKYIFDHLIDESDLDSFPNCLYLQSGSLMHKF